VSNRVEWIVGNVKGPRVLDVGLAGYLPDPRSPHWLHGELRRRFPGVMGIDRDGKVVSDLTALGLTDVHRADAESFEFSRRFDTIVAGEVIEHLSNPGLFLDCAARHLAPGGRLVVTTPYVFGLSNLLYGFFKYPRTCPNREHTCWFCVDTFTQLVRRYGLRVLSWTLLRDYPEQVQAPRYRMLVTAIMLFRFLIPARLASTTLAFVLEPHEDTPRP
jgi:2-polyprenyl-3-methyl-5-hydroxy-6-metoxy-1,4-benzoquinol methylase